MDLIVFTSCVSLITVVVLLLLILHKTREKYGSDYDPNDYDYDRENPNALVQGLNVAGTVYSLEPDNVPGLGWIL